MHTKAHKERSQPVHRAHLGLLEKHKDHVLRARDYHSKQDRLTRLRQKAADKNQDEFYFSMTREKTRNGIHTKDRGNLSLPIDIVKVLKTQDENYIRTMRMAGQKKMDHIKAQLTVLANLIQPLKGDDEGHKQLDQGELETLREAGILPPSPTKAKRKSKHIVFVENDEEANKYIKSRQVPMDVEMGAPDQPPEPVDLGWKASPGAKKKKKQRRAREEKEGIEGDGTEEDIATDAALSKNPLQHRTRLLRELAARLTRDTQLRYATRELEMQRLLMGKGGRKKIRGVEKVEDDEAEKEDEDELDARAGRNRKVHPKSVDAKTWKPRIYKWRVERRRN